MICGTGLRLRSRDIIEKEEMLEAKISSDTSEVICPTCNKSNFTIFRRNKVSQKIYLNHCKCENCGQLFIYNVDKKNNPVLKENLKKDNA